MKKVLREAIKDDIKEIRWQNLEQILSTFKYISIAYLKAYMMFGRGHKVTEESKRIWLEFKDIVLSEDKILRFLKNNTETIDYDAAEDLLDKLDNLNEDTVIYYYDLIDSLEDACETQQEWRITRPRRSFKTLIETDEFYKKALSLTLSMKDIETFLKLPKEFFEYVDKKIITINPYTIEEAEHFYGVYPKVVNGVLTNFRLIVPEVVDDKTASINVNLYSQAFYVYQYLGKEYYLDEEAVKQEASEKEKQFIKLIIDK